MATIDMFHRVRNTVGTSCNYFCFTELKKKNIKSQLEKVEIQIKSNRD